MAHSYTENRGIILDIIREQNPQTILDVGFGAGDYGPLIKKILPDVWLRGLDIWDRHRNAQWDSYDEVILEDMRNYVYPVNSLTLFIDSLEHVVKEDAFKILDKIHNNCLISIPINYKQPEELERYDKHLSEWSLEDFKEYSYKDYSNERSLIILKYA